MTTPADRQGPTLDEIEARARLFCSILHPVIAAALPPDAAGSRALALSFLAAQAEAVGTHGSGSAPGQDDDLPAALHLLPAFIAAEQEAGSGDDLVTLVGRFVRGERARAVQSDAVPSPAAQHWRRLRELERWGVDLSLIEATLALSPLQRIANMERQLRFVRQLQQARRAQETGR